MSPVLPSDFDEVRVLASDSVCTAIVKTYIRFPILLYRLMVWLESSEFKNLMSQAYGHPISGNFAWPISSTAVKAIIKAPGMSTLCERLLSAFTVGYLFYLLVLCWTAEDGSVGPCLARNLCGLSNVGGLAKPQNVNATDGAFTDKVVVTWSAVPEATIYDIFRDPHGEFQFAVSIGSTPSLSFEDLTAYPGVKYTYWLRARSAVNNSPFSDPDTGFADTLIEGNLATVLDLQATQGFSDQVPFNGTDIPIRLAWTGQNHGLPVKWWIYRNTVDDFASAVVVPGFDGKRPDSFMGNQNPVEGDLVDNAAAGTDGVYGNAKLLAVIPKTPFGAEEVPEETTYFFWVVQRLPSQSVGSVESFGTCAGIMAGCPEFDATKLDAGVVTLTPGDEYTIPSGTNRVHVVVFGSGASGAGGSTILSPPNGIAGGGGGGGVAWGLIPSVSVGGKLRLVSSLGAAPSGGALETDGNDGALISLQYSADGLFDDTVDLVICGDGQLAGKGLWDATGGNAAGNGLGAGLTSNLLTPLYGNGGATGGAAQSDSGKLLQHGGLTFSLVRKAAGLTSADAEYDSQGAAGGDPTDTGGAGTLGKCIIWAETT